MDIRRERWLTVRLHIGSGNSIGCCSRGWCSRQSLGQQPEVTGQGPGIRRYGLNQCYITRLVPNTILDKLLAKDVSKQKLSQSDADEARARLTTTSNMDDFHDVDMVIEAVPEILDLKLKIFASLAQICPSHAILSTNTSSISITRIAAATTKDPTVLSASSRVISTHFMNPVPVQKGVEVITGLQTSPETLATAMEFCRRMGKIPSLSADSPGFIANRILMPYINEAIIALETGVGDKESIDAIMKNGTGVPMGPLQLADFIGLDTCLSIMEVLHTGLGDSKYRPAVRLRQMVDAGWFGKKSGKGFYEY
jgi:3-hydroxybutyryl-CoA dehydrogenase